MLTLYGIPNCDTVKKARTWLEENQIDYQFHDFRKDGISAELVKAWFDAHSWDKIINKRSTTWRNIPDDSKETMDESSALTHILQEPTLIKRPVLVKDETILVGFKESDYQELA